MNNNINLEIENERLKLTITQLETKIDLLNNTVYFKYQSTTL